CWQPIPFDNGRGDGGRVTPGFLTPHWYRVKPFALERSDQFRPGPPPKVGSEQLKKEVDEVIAFNNSLTPEQKAVVEFMRDGPRSTGQSGHWLRFAQAVSRRDRHDTDKDVKLFFAVGNVAMDAFIAAWESKRFYDSSRPWTLVRHYYKDQQVLGWAGPGRGVVRLAAASWHPYSPAVFVTPPFPGYVSGHSTVSAACAKVLELFTGSDRFGEKESRKAGMLTEAEFECARMQMREGQSPADAKLTCDVVLDLPTFTATAEMAGVSRVMGGYHIQADNVAGLDLGRKVALYVWPVTQSYFDGTAGRDTPAKTFAHKH
ncbi:MAG TPA: vanadium-dependent haloperoxidase, partial [Pyrinomonadaceae bacterium]|nr:vanadium-dependent haloperoxidase [Pyrinomonadaceae bacterium]